MSDEEIKAIEEARYILQSFSPEASFSCGANFDEDYDKNLNIILNLIKKQQKETEQKDKIIDLMAEYFEGYEIDDVICLNNKEEVIEYFSKK